MQIKESDIKGEIEGFPVEILEKMMDMQECQENKRDLSVFHSCRIASSPGGGFFWDKTLEGHYFWKRVIDEKDFDHFFKRYPKIKKEFSKKTKIDQDGTTKSIKVQRAPVTIRRGERPCGNPVQGRRSKVEVSGSQISYSAIYCS